MKNVALISSAVAVPGVLRANKDETVERNRPLESSRKFRSESVERTIRRVNRAIVDPKVAAMFENCFPNTLDTTVQFSVERGVPDTFVITGDIDAMWLRDSTAQVWPYLPLVDKDDNLRELIEGVIRRQSACINIDPYANAFNFSASGSKWESDITDMKPELHERKWEIDSLCYPIRLAYHFYKQTGSVEHFDESWKSAMWSVLATFKDQQRKIGKGDYSFQRVTSKPTDTCPGGGYGNPAKPNGMICSNFRPSDDATTFLYLIPSNIFAVVSLRQLAEICETVVEDSHLYNKAIDLADEIEDAINDYGIISHPKYGDIYAFEVDGFGNRLLMDDANIPSLLSLPYLGAIDVDNQLYQNTRRFVLSEDNPWFWRGAFAEGVGGPHVGVDYIWPMSIIMRGLTSVDESEVKSCISMLKRSDAGTGFMHESFNKDNPTDFTRSWFAWANTLFGELILKVERDYPQLLKDTF